MAQVEAIHKCSEFKLSLSHCSAQPTQSVSQSNDPAMSGLVLNPFQMKPFQILWASARGILLLEQFESDAFYVNHKAVFPFNLASACWGWGLVSRPVPGNDKTTFEMVTNVWKASGAFGLGLND